MNNLEIYDKNIKLDHPEISSFLQKLITKFVQNASSFIEATDENPLFDGEMVLNSFFVPAFKDISLFLMEYQVNRNIKGKLRENNHKGHVDFWCATEPINCLFEMKSTFYSYSHFKNKIDHANELFGEARKQLEEISNEEFRNLSMIYNNPKYYKITFISIPLHYRKISFENLHINQKIDEGFHNLRPQPNWGAIWNLTQSRVSSIPIVIDDRNSYCPAMLFFAHIEPI